jgi:hypothetical protein
LSNAKTAAQSEHLKNFNMKIAGTLLKKEKKEEKVADKFDGLTGK